MDGNLLDPDNADSTLAKEWSLPELPPDKSSSLPGSSQELADIFGTSDDEEDMEFPFSLNVGKTFSDLTLPDGQETEFFLNSLSSLTDDNSSAAKRAEGGGVQISSSESIASGAVKRRNDEIKESDSAKAKNAGEKDGVKKEENEVKSDEARSNADHKLSGMTLRKSSRLHRNQVPFDPTSSEEVTEKEEKDIKTKLEPAAEAVGEEEEDETDGGTESKRDGGEESNARGGVPEAEGERVKPVSDEEESDDEEDSESDDPDRLWCICQQPHDDRFMICCDQCEEWYHGSCVGISVPQGKRMEREGKEYICPICVERDKQAKREKAVSRSARVDRREKEKELKKKDPSTPVTPTSGGGGGRRRSSSGVGGEGGDQYGLSLLFQPDNAPKGGVTPITEEAELKVKDTAVRTKFKEEYTGTCIAHNCTASTAPPSVFCGEACIERHASYAMKKLSERGISFQSNPSEFVRGSGGVSVIEKATGKMLVGIAAPSEKNLIPWLKVHPSYQILLHKKGKGGSSKKNFKLKPGGVKKEEESAHKFPKISLMDPGSVRANAKRALYQILWKRCEDACDMTNLEQSKVESIANEIEEKLHGQHHDITPKYKNKYRSLVFNLKDTKNQGLFRKVVLGEISPWDLVRMSTEKLASEDLAQWRQKTIKKNIDMIKVREEEAGTMGKVIRKFTYKGEVEIDVAEDTKIETIDISQKDSNEASSEEKKPLTNSDAESVSRSKRSKQKGQSDSKTTGGGGILDILSQHTGSSGGNNTTSQHGNHVYDQHCDVCTGKASPPPAPFEPALALSPPQSVPEPMEAESSVASVGKVSSEEEVPEALDSSKKVIWKGFVNMSGLAKFATLAHHVSGPIDNLEELLPDTLHVMGRIAHVQVWDYMDKLRSSSTRDIVVLRFQCVEDEKDCYTSMLTYLVKKHRCGVISCCFPGMKDMYLVPLQSGRQVASQLLPFKGPGLPQEREDMLLGLIVRSKVHRSSSRLDESPKSFATQKINAEVCIKRHHSGSVTEDHIDTKPPAKRARITIEVGVGGETPPHLGGFQDDDDHGVTTPTYNSAKERGMAVELNDGNSSPSPVEQTSQNVQMSFYGEHRPLSDPKPESQSSHSSIQTGTQHESKPAVSTMAADKSAPISTSTTTTTTGGGNLSALLSQLSDEKLLKDLASAVSTISKKPSFSQASAVLTITDGNHAATPTHIAARTGRVDYGANTPPLDDEEETNSSMPRVAGGPPMPRVAGGPPMPRVAGGPPMPRVAGGPPMPRVAGGPPMPRVAGGPLMPRVTGGPLMPRVAGGPLMPRVAGGPPMPRVAGGPPMPRVAGGPPMPRVAGGPPMPRVAGGPPMPRVAGGPPMPRVAGGPPMPRVARGPPMPPQHGVNKHDNHQGNPPPPSQPVNEDNDNSSEWHRDRERFANTPPPDFQPYPQEPKPAAPPTYQNNNYPDPRTQPYPPHPPTPQSHPQHQEAPGPNYYNYPSQQHQHQEHYPPQQNWDHYRSHHEDDHSKHDPRYRGRGYEYSRGGGDHHHEKYRKEEKTKYPPEWYRKS